MTGRWPHGEAEVEQQIAAGNLQKVTGSQANGAALLAKASRTIESATALVEDDPDSSYVLAYDAARYAVTSLLAHQGLRPTSKGGHYVVEQIVRAQFGSGFRVFGDLRRRRNELEYPTVPGEEARTEEAQRAADDVGTLISAAEQLLPNLALF